MAVRSQICVCGESRYHPWSVVNNIPIVECTACGIRRVPEVDSDKYSQMYTSGDYHVRGSDDLPHESAGREPHVTRFSDDLRVAEVRLQKLLRFKNAGRLLDVGCANGAFMYAAQSYFDVYGCDLASDAVIPDLRKRVYCGALNDIGFARRTVDVITFNDSIEHFIDPAAALKAAHGLLKRDGLLVVDIPDMGCADADEQGSSFKHVKPHEHLWYFTAAQLHDFLLNAGFNVVKMEVPVAGKMAIYASPAAEVQEVTVKGPTGIGDTLWTLHKLKGIRERESPCRIHYVVCCGDKGEKPSVRSRDFLLLCPYIDSLEFRESVWPYDNGCRNPSLPVYELVANDYLEPGGGLIENWHPELPNDFDIGIQVPDAAIQQADWRIQKDYVAVYMSSCQWNRITTLPAWTAKHWAEVCIGLHENGLTPLILGAEWDSDYASEVSTAIADLGYDPHRIWVNAIGKTPLTLAMAYMKKAKATIGICSGLPMLSAYFGWPTVIMWPTKGISNTCCQFGSIFQSNWLPPSVRAGATYKGLSMGAFTPANLVADTLLFVGGELHASSS